MEKTKVVKLPNGKVVEIDLEHVREASRKARNCSLRPKPGANFGPLIIYDRDSPDVAADRTYLPFYVQHCKDLAKFAIDSFNRDNPHIPPYSTDSMELIRAARHGAVLFRLTFTTIPRDVVVLSGSVSSIFEAELCSSLALPIAEAEVRYVKIRDHPLPPPPWTTGELPFAVNMR